MTKQINNKNKKETKKLDKEKNKEIYYLVKWIISNPVGYNKRWTPMNREVDIGVAVGKSCSGPC